MTIFQIVTIQQIFFKMINKFSNISSTISKIIEEGIELALEIDTGNMYDYDYILKHANYYSDQKMYFTYSYKIVKLLKPRTKNVSF